MATIDIIKDVFESNLGIEPEQITDDVTFDSLGIDSLDMVELICELEERCGIEFGDADGIVTVGDLVAHIESR